MSDVDAIMKEADQERAAALQKMFDLMLELLPASGKLTIRGVGGWELMVKLRSQGSFDFTHRNPTDHDQYKFFIYDTTGNPYGAGMIVQEPTLGVPCRQCGVEADGAIVGAIVLNAEGKVTARFSWSNLMYMKDKLFHISADGELVVDGESHGYLAAVFLPDKNRMQGYVAVFKPVKPETVKVLEMENLLLASL